jgi:hypothetical protein
MVGTLGFMINLHRLMSCIDSPMVQLRIPGSSMIFLNSGEDIKELFVNRSRNYSDR